MPKKLKQFLESEKIKASHFAAAIGYNDGAISHILNGRNKPAWEMLCKIVATYPQLNPDWLLLGQGPMYRPGMEPGQVTSQPMPIPTIAKEEQDDELPFGSSSTVAPVAQPTTPPTPSSRRVESLAIGGANAKPIKRIVVLYADNTFESFTPGEE